MPRLEVTHSERKAYPTYDTAKRVVDGNDITAPIEFLAWTAIRSLLIMPGMAIAGVRGKKLVLGAFFGSMLVSTSALWRSYATKQSELWKKNRQNRARLRASQQQRQQLRGRRGRRGRRRYR